MDKKLYHNRRVLVWKQKTIWNGGQKKRRAKMVEKSISYFMKTASERLKDS